MRFLKIPAISLFLSSFCISSAFAAAPPMHKSTNMQMVINSLQQQIQRVQASIPLQIKAQAQANNKQSAALQRQMQKQIVVLQKQIQQVQNSMVAQIKALQKEVNQLALIK